MNEGLLVGIRFNTVPITEPSSSKLEVFVDEIAGRRPKSDPHVEHIDLPILVHPDNDDRRPVGRGPFTNSRINIDRSTYSFAGAGTAVLEELRFELLQLARPDLIVELHVEQVQQALDSIAL